MSRSGSRRPVDRRLALGLAVSLLAHLLLLLLLATREPESATEAPRREAVRLRVLDKAAEAARARAATKADGQVVDLPKPAREEAPDEARFLSAWNTKVDRERKSRREAAGKAGSPRGGGTPEAGAAPPSPITSPSAANVPGPEEGQPVPPAGAPARPGAGRRALAGLDRMLVPSLGGGMAAARGAAAAGEGPFGGTVSADAFLGVPEEGDATLVNSRSFKFWDFFHRVKERVRGEWTPGDLYERRDPNGKVYGTRDRLTVLTVVLDARGAVQRLEVVRESGLPFLDEEAIRAFRQAGPFPNPPAGLADDQGRIAFTFGFLLEVGATRGRFFWERGNGD